MINKHTPGPWHRNIAPASRYPTVFAGRNTHIARVITDGLSPEEVEANIALIAEAPAMLEALRALVDAMPTPATRKLTAAWDDARAILSRIDGTQGVAA